MHGLDEADLANLKVAAARLRADGWANFVTFDHLLQSWRRLGQEVARYDATVDDYTNDLTARQGLHLLMQHCHPTTAARVAALLDSLDGRFQSGTDPDSQEVLGHFYKMDESSGWWMRRIPKAGDLRAYLDQAAVDTHVD